MKKIYINPKVPEWMDDKDIEQRSETHLKKWWCRAYIRTQEYTEDTYTEYCERMSEFGNLETEQEFDRRRKEDYEQWLKWWPHEGIRYDVRILDGGAWDRTTNKGHFNNLDEAIEYCKALMS